MASKSMISIIVPVYKVEPYLDKCVRSIVEQTYADLEIILVDDGSPDNCPAMCDAWAEKDSRIKVIHKKNGGLSDARNAGTEAASGEYILFVDSDDWIAPEMCGFMLARMNETNSDIVSCDAVRVWDDSTPQRKMMRDNEPHVLDRTEAMRALIQSTCLIMTVWNKLYKAQIVKKIPFEKGKIHEDEIWSWQAIGAATRVATVSEAFYYYRQRADGIMGDGYTGFPMIVIRAKQQRHDYIVKEIPALSDIDSENLLNTCFYQGVQVINHEKRDRRRDFIKQLKQAASECEFTKDYYSGLSFSKKIKLTMMKRSLGLACRLAVMRGVK